MSETKYDYNAIRLLRSKYKWMIWLYKFICVLVLCMIALNINRLIPDRFDVIGYFDAEYNYHYLFGLKSLIEVLAIGLAYICLFVVIHLILKAILKEHYAEFLAAKHNGNVSFLKYKAINKGILFLLCVAVVVSVRNIGSIKVGTNEFYLQESILSVRKSVRYDFDYLEIHKPYVSGANNIAFYNTKSENGGLVLDFNIGKYSSSAIEFLEVLDQRTDNKYFLTENLNN